MSAPWWPAAAWPYGSSSGGTSFTETEPPAICPYFVADPDGLCEYCGDPAEEHTLKALGK